MYVRANAPNWHEADLEDVLGEGDDAGVGILGEEGGRALRLHGPSIPVVPAGLGGAGLADGVLDLDKVAVVAVVAVVVDPLAEEGVALVEQHARDCPGPKTARKGRSAATTSIQMRHTDSIYCGEL